MGLKLENKYKIFSAPNVLVQEWFIAKIIFNLYLKKVARRWTKKEKILRKKELSELYIKRNLPIKEVGKILGIAEQTVYDRLVRLNIPANRSNKPRYNNSRTDIVIPKNYTSEIAELFGIMLGDGHISKYQIFVTLGSKELSYANYVASLLEKIFGVSAKISKRKTGYTDVYIGSYKAVRWLLENGLVQNKVVEQVDIPSWIFNSKNYQRRFIRGFFDTDGSVYKLRFGTQISFTNQSKPLLKSLQKMLRDLEYTPSLVSGSHVYITKRAKIDYFFKSIKPKNIKHLSRYKNCVGR